MLDSSWAALNPTEPRGITFFNFTHFSFCSKPGDRITHNAITGGNLADHKQLPLEQQKASHIFFSICIRTPKDLSTHFNMLRCYPLKPEI